MSGAMDSAVELEKLGHALGVAPARLAGLASVPAPDLRVLRGQITDALFEADRARFARMAALSQAVPATIAAKLTEFALPPLLAARTAELIDPQRAVELVRRMSDGYLADVSAAMDASRVPALLARLPRDRVAMVGAELARRRQWVVIVGFVAQISAAALTATVPVLDGEQLLHIGFVLEDKTRLDDISESVTDAQIDQMLAAAATRELWTELDDLLAHLGADRVARMRSRFVAAPADVVAAVLAAASAGALSSSGLATLTA